MSLPDLQTTPSPLALHRGKWCKAPRTPPDFTCYLFCLKILAGKCGVVCYSSSLQRKGAPSSAWSQPHAHGLEETFLSSLLPLWEQAGGGRAALSALAPSVPASPSESAGVGSSSVVWGFTEAIGEFHCVFLAAVVGILARYGCLGCFFPPLSWGCHKGRVEKRDVSSKVMRTGPFPCCCMVSPRGWGAHKVIPRLCWATQDSETLSSFVL